MVRKRGTVWEYVFDAPGSTRNSRKQIRASGFPSQRKAKDAEAQRRIEEQEVWEKSQGPQAGTLGSLLASFLADRRGKLAPKTLERYEEQVKYLDPQLTRMKAVDVTPLQLSTEWQRLLERGGHVRGTKEPRPLSEKTVHNIAGVVSSAYGWAILRSLVKLNPVTHSEPPVARKHRGVALTPQQQELLYGAATSPWCLGMFLELSAATGARRGEILALRWTDLNAGRVTISRSLSQTDAGVIFKEPKTEDSVRTLSLPASTLERLEAHRAQQDEFRTAIGPKYKGDLIFANPDGTPLKPDSISAAVSLLCRKIGLPKGVSLHTLRHSHGSHLLAAGMDLPTVSERLGHSSTRVTADVYTHAIRGRDDQAAALWDKFQQSGKREEKVN